MKPICFYIVNDKTYGNYFDNKIGEFFVTNIETTIDKLKKSMSSLHEKTGLHIPLITLPDNTLFKMNLVKDAELSK